MQRTAQKILKIGVYAMLALVAFVASLLLGGRHGAVVGSYESITPQAYADSIGSAGSGEGAGSAGSGEGGGGGGGGEGSGSCCCSSCGGE